MNHVYRVVFNHSLGVYQCVSELAKSRGKSSGKSQVATKLILAPLTIAMLGLSGTAMAVTYDDGKTTTINDDVYFVENDTVSKLGTELIVNSLIVEKTASGEPSKLYIHNNGIVTAKDNTAVVADAEIRISNKGNLNAKDIFIGLNDGNGNLSVDRTGLLNADNLWIGNQQPNAQGGNKGIVDIDDSTVNIANEVLVAGETIGSLNVTGKSELTAGQMSIGYNAGSVGEVSVQSNGIDNQITNLISERVLNVGKAGKGTLTVSNAGGVESQSLHIGRDTTGEGEVNVTDFKTRLKASELVVGNAGNGKLNISKQAEVTTDSLYVGYANDASGTIILNQRGILNVTGDVGVGINGTGKLQLSNTSSLNVGGNLITGNKANSKNNVIEVGRSDEEGYTDTSVNVKKQIQIGDLTDGSLIVSNGFLKSEGNFIIGNKVGSNGNVLVKGTNAGLARAGTGSDMAVGLEGKGTLNIQENGFAFAKGLVSVGGGSTGMGTVNIEGGGGAGLDAGKLIVGENGNGSVNVKNSYDPIDKSWSYALDVDENTIIGEGIQGVGKITVDNAMFIAGDLIVGNKGSGTLDVTNKSVLQVDGFSRGSDSKLSDVYFDNAYLVVTKDQPNLFANFTEKEKINIGSGGLIFNAEQNNVTIDSNAVLRGNVGAVNWDELKGGFIKVGNGTLTMSSNSKKWTGETLIAEGLLEINGDYIIKAGDALGIALDVENKGDLTQYGKLLVNGTADIRDGELKVYASDAITVMAGNNEWKDIVKATTRQGTFKKVSDNSPLVSFYADYTDANAVHLKMGTAPVVEPPVKPEPPVVEPPVKPEPPVVEPPVKPEPPVVEPPVKPEPPVVDPTDTDSTFVAAANSQSDKQALNLATVLDKAMMNKKSPLAIQLIADTEDLVDNPTLEQRQIRMNKTVYQLQPLFMGATNRIITDANYAVSDAITEHRPTTAQSSIWAKIIGNDSSHDAENGITGYNSDGYGAIVGLDTPINSNLNLGVAVSYVKTDADTDGSNLDHELTAKNWQILGYGNYAASAATDVNFHAGAGSSDVKGERHLSILSNATATSDYSVDTLQAGLGVSHLIGDVQRNITPFAQVNYAQAKSDSYRETGAGVYNLNVDENKYESMRWTAGLRMSQLLTPKLALTGQLAAAIENGDKYSDITASFVGMPNDKFTTIGQEVGREIGIAGIGLSYTASPNMKISAGYRGEWRDNYDDQGASIALQTTF